MTIDVVIPARNEASTVADVVCAALACRYTREVVVVDDGSTDGTAAVAEKHAAGWDAFRILRHRKNQGKTEALDRKSVV